MKSGGVTVASPKKPREMLKLVITAFGGGLVGAFVGMFFMRYGVPSSLGALQTQQPQYFDYRPPAPKDLEPIMCTREKPQGTETLPPDIIDVSTDLFPRRLWGVPEEDLPETPKYLLTFTVGVSQKEGVNEAVKKFSKEFQVLLFHYDGKVSEWDEYEWSRTAIHISTRKQAKWWYAKRFLHPDVVEPYEYIFIWDEDLDLTHFNATMYIELVKKHGLEISQPALAPDRGLTWQMTKRRGDVEVHKEAVEQPGWCTDPHKPPCAGFVEIMAPVFSAKAWRCVWHMIQVQIFHTTYLPKLWMVSL